MLCAISARIVLSRGPPDEEAARFDREEVESRCEMLEQALDRERADKESLEQRFDRVVEESEREYCRVAFRRGERAAVF